MGSHRENRHIDIGDNEDINEDDTKILLRVQGADLRRFDMYKKRLHLTTILWDICQKRNASMELEKLHWVWSDLIASLKHILFGIRNIILVSVWTLR